MKLIFVRAIAKGYSSASYNEKNRAVYIPMLADDDFNLDTCKLTPVGVEYPGSLEYARLANGLHLALREL